MENINLYLSENGIFTRELENAITFAKKEVAYQYAAAHFDERENENIDWDIISCETYFVIRIMD